MYRCYYSGKCYDINDLQWAMIYKMTDLKIKAPHPFKKKQKKYQTLTSIKMDIGDLGRWVSILNIYLRKLSTWVIDFLTHPDNREWYLSILKKKLFKIYRGSCLNGKRIFLCTLLPWCKRIEIIILKSWDYNVTQYVMNSENLSKISWIQVWFKEQKGREY